MSVEPTNNPAKGVEASVSAACPWKFARWARATNRLARHLRADGLSADVAQLKRRSCVEVLIAQYLRACSGTCHAERKLGMTDAEFCGDEIIDLAGFFFAGRNVELCVWIEQRGEPVALRFDQARFRRDEE